MPHNVHDIKTRRELRISGIAAIDNKLESIRGLPILVWGSPNQNGDTNAKTEIPNPKWGCASQESPYRFEDLQTEIGIKKSPYQNRDPRTEMGIVQSLTRIGLGFVPIWALG